MNKIIIPMELLYFNDPEEDIFENYCKYAVNEMIFDEFVLALQQDHLSGNINLHVKLNKGTHDLMFEEIDKIKINYEYYYVEGDCNESENGFWYGRSDGMKSDPGVTSFMNDMYTRILRSCYFIMNVKRDHKELKPSHKYSREHRISTSNNKIYLLSDIVKYVYDNYTPQGNHNSFMCPCWEVRGHYRHYKSGKTVFIRAYKKGKQRDKVAPKEKEYYV